MIDRARARADAHVHQGRARQSVCHAARTHNTHLASRACLRGARCMCKCALTSTKTGSGWKPALLLAAVAPGRWRSSTAAAAAVPSAQLFSTDTTCVSACAYACADVGPCAHVWTKALRGVRVCASIHGLLFQSAGALMLADPECQEAVWPAPEPTPPNRSLQVPCVISPSHPWDNLSGFGVARQACLSSCDLLGGRPLEGKG